MKELWVLQEIPKPGEHYLEKPMVHGLFESLEILQSSLKYSYHGIPNIQITYDLGHKDGFLAKISNGRRFLIYQEYVITQTTHL